MVVPQAPCRGQVAVNDAGTCNSDQGNPGHQGRQSQKTPASVHTILKDCPHEKATEDNLCADLRRLLAADRRTSEKTFGCRNTGDSAALFCE